MPLGEVRPYTVMGSAVLVTLAEIGKLNGNRKKIDELITCESGVEGERIVWTARKSILDLTSALDGAGLTREN